MSGAVVLFLLIVGIVAVMIVKNNQGEGELKDITELVMWSVVGIILLMFAIFSVAALF
ncbi:MAG: hypothetical protein HOI42_14855 [Candidatus Marinimicrobia bacterium]|jgi:hypothetical protein|nr:hypothetical protein [Candidatus Neomarinimicrobiota bacterium]